MMEQKPERIGKYRVLDVIGRGGMGVIYKAVQEPLNRIVALKVLSTPAYTSEAFQRFETEAKAISLLEHHNVVSIYDYGEADGCPYFAMQFVDGQGLDAIIRDYGKFLPFARVVDIAKQLCRGLRYAHSRNIVHRDIKPPNVLIDTRGVVKLTDFGIAKIFAEKGLTMTGISIGTPEYMSPEQAEGVELDARTDIYSLGIVLYEMLTRQVPFSGKNPVAIAYKQVHDIPVPPSAIRRDTPKRLELIVIKALKKDKRERYAAVDEMLAHLDTVDVNEPPPHHKIPVKLTNLIQTRQKSFQEKRITDRRGGDRRMPKTGLFRLLLSRDYWFDMLRTQWLSWLLIGMLALIFLCHVAGHA